MNTLTIAVGTANAAKLEAVQSVFQAAFSDVTIVAVEAESGVDAQPMDDETSINGATNRAVAALEATPGADYGVGMEGNVALTAGRMFLRGWVVIIDVKGNSGLGHSGGVEIPEAIARKLQDGAELGPLMKELMHDATNEIRHTQGSNGIMTDGLYTRVDEFTHATQCALARFVKPELY